MSSEVIRDTLFTGKLLVQIRVCDVIESKNKCSRSHLDMFLVYSTVSRRVRKHTGAWVPAVVVVVVVNVVVNVEVEAVAVAMVAVE